MLPPGIPRSRCPVNPPSSVRASTVKGQQLCQGGILQAWPKTGHKEQCFHFYLSDFGSVMSLPLPTYLALSHLSAVFHDVGVSWWCFMVVFVDQQELPRAGHEASTTAGCLGSDVVPEGTVGIVGWSCALCSAQPTGDMRGNGECCLIS